MQSFFGFCISLESDVNDLIPNAISVTKPLGIILQDYALGLIKNHICEQDYIENVLIQVKDIEIKIISQYEVKWPAGNQNKSPVSM